MAGSTINFRMLTLQWEERLGVVKVGRGPVIKLVASPTISRTIYFKLPAMYIVMTVSTLLCETHKLPVRVLLVFLMAGCAVGLFVYSL